MKKGDNKKPIWSYDVARALTALKTERGGLTLTEQIRRLKTFGPNRLETKHHFDLPKIIAHQFASPLIFILLAAGGLTLFLGEWLDATVIGLAIAVNTALGSYQEARAGNALAKLRSYIRERARVIRGGIEQEVEAESLVPGDVLRLAYGNRVPADARLLSINDCAVDESILTGESLPITKTIDPLSEAAPLPDRTNMVFGGTLVTSGYATAVVTATGRESELGRIAALVARATNDSTPLQRGVGRLAWLITAIMAAVVTGIFVLGIHRGENIAEMFVVSAAVAVGAIPEALPIALTVVLSVGVEQLAKRQGIMRHLGAAETLGSTSVIITDKTGTLTEANMQLVNVLPVADILNKPLPTAGTPARKLSREEKDLLTLAAFNTNVLVANPEDPRENWRLVGRPLETNIIKSLLAHGLAPLTMLKKAEFHLLLPFSSNHRFSAVLVHGSTHLPPPLNRHSHTLLCLGAPDTILKKSKLPKDDYLRLQEAVEKMSNQGKRLLGLALKPIKKESVVNKLAPDDVTDVEFLGLLAFYDPLRPSVPAAIKQIEDSGLRVIIATGDLPGTAEAVAAGLGWQLNPGQILTGEEMRRLTDEELLENLENIKIFARVTPEDKLRVGRLYQARGEVVGMTGDGVNDAPSLQAMDIGIAVGSGSDVAKEVADLVLLNDNFETIVKAIEEGRRILANIRKTFVYLMSNSLDEVFLIGGSLILGLPLPLTALQIIWVNFFTGSLPALSFAFDRSPEQKNFTVSDTKTVLNAEVRWLSISVGVLISSLLLALYHGLITQGVETDTARTFLFACFASYILLVAFSFRSLRQAIFRYNPLANRFLNWSVLGSLGLIALTIYWPPFQKIFGTTALSPAWLLWLLLWLFFTLAIVEMAKWLYRFPRHTAKPI